jgi:hypothetical protein
MRPDWRNGHDARVGKVQAHERAIVGGQVHAHRTHLGFAFQALKTGLQRKLGAAQDHVVDFVVAQVTERGGVAGCGA